MGNVVLEGVTKKFQDQRRGEVVAVNEVSFEVHDGEFLVLVGPSGCGKTTTLRMVAGLERQTYGDIYIGGRLVNLLPPKDRDIAMVFQDYALYPHMSVYDNLSFGLRNLGVDRKTIDQKVQTVAELLQIGRLLQRRPRELSGGQRQRVALGRAIVRSPQVFLFDEPLSNLDAKLRVQMRVDLLDLHRRLGNTVVYVTHDQVEAMTLGDRIVIMLDGIVQQIDSPRDIYERPRNTFVASFMGAPPMNLVPGEIDAEGVFRTDGLTITIPPDAPARQQAIDSRAVVLGVRPDDMAEAPVDRGDMAGTVRAVEFVGSETLVHLDVGRHLLTARLGPQADILPGHTLAVRLDFARVSFFDTETQERLN